MAANAEEDVLDKTPAPPEDKLGLRTRTSNGDDGGGGKDRERPRQQVIQTRPTLSAVGRVASRVRTSGISKISTLLPKVKDDEEVNVSPWGVGTAAVSRSQSTSVSPSDITASGNNRPIRSPKANESSDVLEMSSPISTDTAQSPPTEQINVTIAVDDRRRGLDPARFQKGGSHAAPGKVAKATGDRARVLEADRARAPESPVHGKAPRPRETHKSTEQGKVLERLGSKTVRSKFHFRPSLQMDSRLQVSRDAENDAPFAHAEHRSNMLEPSPGVKVHEPRDGTGKDNSGYSNTAVESLPGTETIEKGEGNMSTSRVTFVSSPAVDHELEGMESIQDSEKSRTFTFTGFGRSKSRVETQKQRSKAEKPRGKLGISRSKSHAAKKFHEQEQMQPEDSMAAVPGKKNSPRSQGNTDDTVSRRNSTAVRGKRVLWFNLKKEDDGGNRSGKQGGGMKARTKSRREEVAKVQEKIPIGPAFFARQASTHQQDTSNPLKTIRFARKRGKGGGKDMAESDASSIGIEIVNADKVTINSDDEDEDSASQVRSLAVDDFISYQTKQGKKGKAKP